MNVQNELHADEQEKPLDPATEKVRKKMVRLLATSIGIMMIGLMAVLAAIVYKIGGSGEETETATINQGAASGLRVPEGMSYEGTIDLPDGASIEDSSLSGGQVLLRVKLADGTRELWLYDVAASRVFGRITLN